MEELLGISFVMLLEMILLDLVLGGDNAVVIALAAKNLPSHLQKKAILWGTLGAVILRLFFAGIIVLLLDIPFLHLIGGLLLVYIAIKLLIGEKESHQEGGTTLWSAIKTIIIADAVMSLDNVLAMAGVAHGNFLAIIIGILISIPIIIFGSKVILKGMQKFPIIIYAGAALLAYTAAEMIIKEPFLHTTLSSYELVLVIGTPIIVLLTGFIVSKKKKNA